MSSEGTGGNSLKLCLGEVQIRSLFFPTERALALKLVAQGGGEFTQRGIWMKHLGILFRGDHGGAVLDKMVLKVSSNTDDSVI